MLAVSASTEQTSTMNLMCWMTGNSLSCKAARQRGHTTAIVAPAVLCAHSPSLDLVAQAQAWHSQLEGKHEFESLQGKGSIMLTMINMQHTSKLLR